MTSPITVVIVPHTHWDREWYEPEARFRQRLVAALDDALDRLASGELGMFLLDGQTVLLRDYLSVRPERAADVRRLVRAGRLLVGPWYVLADELLPADETLVRNLLVGRADGRRHGGWLAVGYSPDAFGHPAALPTILRGFGIAHAIVWRGCTGEQGADLFRWRSPDGSSVLLHHLPPPGYELGANLPRERAALQRRWSEIRGVLEPRAAHGVLLLLNGADHHAPQQHLPEIVRRLGGLAPRHRFRVGSPADYFAALPRAPAIPIVDGELRRADGHAWALQGTLATRTGLKQRIAEAERLLLRWAEPQAALAWVAGGADRRALLDAAWRAHLENCFHDTICGTTSDEVAWTAGLRTRSVAVQARGVLDDALHERLGQDRGRARHARSRWSPTLVVVNPSPFARGGVLEATVTFPRRQVVVGRAPTAAARRSAPPPGAVALVDGRGASLPLQVLDRQAAWERLDSPRDYPAQDEVWAYRVALYARDVPALGTRAYRARDRGGAARLAERVGARGRSITAPWCRVTGGDRTGFSLHERETKRRWHALGHLVSEHDLGDTYTFQPARGGRPRRAVWGRARTVWRGPLVAALAREFRIGDAVRGTVYARLDAGSRLVRVVVEGENRAGQHRLRLALPLGDAGRRGRTLADMAYGSVTRQREALDVPRFSREWPVATAPMHRWVSVPDGLTLFARGLYEYELAADGTLWITLLRSVAELSRGDLAARPGHAGWPVATPNALEFGRFRTELAFATETVADDRGPAAWDRVERLAEEFHAPLGGRMFRYGLACPERLRGPELSGAGLALKAVKPSADGRALVLRCVNVTATSVVGAWHLPFRARRAERARLDERATGRLPVRSGGRVVRFDAGPREVVTVRVEP